MKKWRQTHQPWPKHLVVQFATLRMIWEFFCTLMMERGYKAVNYLIHERYPSSDKHEQLWILVFVELDTGTSRW